MMFYGINRIVFSSLSYFFGIATIMNFVTSSRFFWKQLTTLSKPLHVCALCTNNWLFSRDLLETLPMANHLWCCPAPYDEKCHCSEPFCVQFVDAHCPHLPLYGILKLLEFARVFQTIIQFRNFRIFLNFLECEESFDILRFFFQFPECLPKICQNSLLPNATDKNWVVS